MSDEINQISHPYQGHYMREAFESFVVYASRELMDEFESECGQMRLGATPLDCMIDNSTGHDVREAQRFVDWCVLQFGAPDQI